MKKILLSLATLLLANLGFTQITVVSIPDQIEAGATVDLQFTYTSSAVVDFTVQLFKTNENALTVDYTTGSYQAGKTISDLPAGTAVPITISFTVPGTVNPSSTLTNREYTFDLKLTDASTNADFGWNNGTADHVVEILPSSVVVDNINFTSSTPATINPGEMLTFNFEYTLTEIRNVKAGLAIYNSSGNYVDNAMDGADEVAQYFSTQAATTTTPVSQTASIQIPATLTPSSQLANGNVYKVVITIAQSPSWAYITDKKNDIIINTLAGLHNATLASKINVFPNPANEVVNVSYPGTIEAINVYSAAGVKMEVEATVLNNGQHNLNMSAFPKGVYILNVSTNDGTTSVKLVK